jgi:hypothetical protein
MHALFAGIVRNIAEYDALHELKDKARAAQAVEREQRMHFDTLLQKQRYEMSVKAPSFQDVLQKRPCVVGVASSNRPR